jgi:hypothetical protein
LAFLALDLGGLVIDGLLGLWLHDGRWRHDLDGNLVMPTASDRLEKLLAKETQLKARIQLEKSRLSASSRKERTGKLVAWGVAVEQLLADETFKAEWWKLQCQRVLSGRTLERALMEDSTPEGNEG